MVQAIPGKCILAVYDLDRRKHRYVAGAFCDHRNKFEPRLPAVFVGDVQPDDLRLDDVCGHPRILLYADIFIRTVPPDHFDLRGANFAACSKCSRPSAGF